MYQGKLNRGINLAAVRRLNTSFLTDKGERVDLNEADPLAFIAAPGVKISGCTVIASENMVTPQLYFIHDVKMKVLSGLVSDPFAKLTFLPSSWITIKAFYPITLEIKQNTAIEFECL